MQTINKGDHVFNANADTFKLHQVVQSKGHRLLIATGGSLKIIDRAQPADGDWRKPIPILFSTERVRAILAGRKGQDRRLLNHPHEFDEFWRMDGGVAHFNEVDFPLNVTVECPHRPGDVLWARESWNFGYPNPDGTESYSYRADDGDDTDMKWRPSIHMPFAAARIFLGVKSCRPERLREISEADAVAEGCHGGGTWESAPSIEFSQLWEKIYGPHSWAANPWVWATAFRHLPAPIIHKPKDTQP